MKSMKKVLSVALLLLMSFIITACDDKNNDTSDNGFNIVDNPENIILPTGKNYQEPRDRYDNKFGEDNIPGQWEGYGIGDPYILRFNGVYYLYVSTKDSEVGIRAWQST